MFGYDYDISWEKIKLGIIFVLAVIGLLHFYDAIMDFDASKKTPIEYSSVDAWQLKNGMFVEGDLPYNYGAFEEKDVDILTGRRWRIDVDYTYTYVIPINGMYMGLQTKDGDKEDLFDIQARTTLNKFNGMTDEQPEKVHFVGKVCGMSNKEKKLAKEYLMNMGVSESDVTAKLRPYKLIKWDDFYNSRSNAWNELKNGSICIFIVLVLLFGQWLIDEIKSRKNEKRKQEYFQKLEEPKDTIYSEDDIKGWRR